MLQFLIDVDLPTVPKLRKEVPGDHGKTLFIVDDDNILCVFIEGGYRIMTPSRPLAIRRIAREIYPIILCENGLCYFLAWGCRRECIEIAHFENGNDISLYY